MTAATTVTVAATECPEGNEVPLVASTMATVVTGAARPEIMSRSHASSARWR
jgi:hypothetical protein